MIVSRFVNLGADIFISWLEISENYASHLSEGLQLQIELTMAHFELTWQQVLLLLVPSWHQNGTEFNSLNMFENQVFAENEIKKGT